MVLIKYTLKAITNILEVNMSKRVGLGTLSLVQVFKVYNNWDEYENGYSKYFWIY